MRKWCCSVKWCTAVSLVTALVWSGVSFADGGPNHQQTLTRPIPLGSSGGSNDDRDGGFCCGGTLGGVLQDAGGTFYIVSNNHVLGRTNRAIAGEDTVQPGLIDVACNQNLMQNIVADFTEFIPIDFDVNNLVDAAIAEVRTGQVDTTGTQLDIGSISSDVVNAFAGMNVQKDGRTSGHTTGTVVEVNVTVNVAYPKKCGGRGGPGAIMEDQFRITDGSFSTGGDSGSLIFESGNNPRAVGLLFAGSSTSTIANRIQNVLNAGWSVGPLAMAGGTTPVCGDGTCDSGEDSCNCADDCGAPPATETSCSDGTDNDCDGATDCDDPDCNGDPACPSCGDGTCDAGEDSCNCAADCGDPSASETNCTDGVDNDCDGLADCADADCSGDPACETGSAAIVDCITYDKNVKIAILIVDDLGNPVSGASVTPEVFVNGASIGTATGTTNGSGVAGFRLRGTSNGDCIETDVLTVVASGLTYDGSEPVNGYLKGTDAKPDADCRSGSDVCGSSSNASGPGRSNRPNVELVAIPLPGARMTLAEVSAIKRRNSDRLLGITDVVGHGIGRAADGNPVIVVYLVRENAASRAQVGPALEGVPVRVEVTGPFEAY